MKKNQSIDLHIATKLKILRLKKNITQKCLADKLNLTTIELIAFENGENPIPAVLLWNISLYFKISFEYFFLDIKQTT